MEGTIGPYIGAEMCLGTSLEAGGPPRVLDFPRLHYAGSSHEEARAVLGYGDDMCKDAAGSNVLQEIVSGGGIRELGRDGPVKQTAVLSFEEHGVAQSLNNSDYGMFVYEQPLTWTSAPSCVEVI